jgi:hypothetical protein
MSAELLQEKSTRKLPSPLDPSSFGYMDDESKESMPSQSDSDEDVDAFAVGIREERAIYLRDSSTGPNTAQVSHISPKRDAAYSGHTSDDSWDALDSPAYTKGNKMGWREGANSFMPDGEESDNGDDAVDQALPDEHHKCENQANSGDTLKSAFGPGGRGGRSRGQPRRILDELSHNRSGSISGSGEEEEDDDDDDIEEEYSPRSAHSTSSNESEMEQWEEEFDGGNTQPMRGHKQNKSSKEIEENKESDEECKGCSPTRSHRSRDRTNQEPKSLPSKLKADATATTSLHAIRGSRPGESIGLKPKVADPSKIPYLTNDLITFLCAPLREGQGKVIRCFVERKRGGASALAPTYSFFADLEDGSGRLLMSARKVLKSKTAHYIICVDRNDLNWRGAAHEHPPSYLGKLREVAGSNRNEYILYDNGRSPSDLAGGFAGNSGHWDDAEESKVDDQMCLRQELAAISYDFTKGGATIGKRRMQVALPRVHPDSQNGGGRQHGPGALSKFRTSIWRPTRPRDSMLASFELVRQQGAQNQVLADRMEIFHQRESRYDPLSSCLVDFRSRATSASVKNFQLIRSTPESTTMRERFYSKALGEGWRRGEVEGDDVLHPVILQHGKVGKHCFNVDVEWPMSLLQAFGIVLSRFDTNAKY